MAEAQNFKNHARFDPLFHFFVIPLLILNLAFAIYATIHAWPGFMHTHLWWIVMSFVLFGIAGVARSSALRAQDRIIRLEEQLRLADLLPEDQLDLVDAVTIDQFIALRFASDPEVVLLAQRAVAEKLTRKQIKESIVHWRPDNHRV